MALLHSISHHSFTPFPPGLPNHTPSGRRPITTCSTSQRRRSPHNYDDIPQPNHSFTPFPPGLPNHTPSGRRPITTCSTSQRRRSPHNYDDIPQPKKLPRKAPPRSPPRRRLITISTSDGKYHGKWSCDYVFTLRDIQLADLAEDKNAQVFLTLYVHKHAGFGFSVDGKITTSFNRKCSCCFVAYCSKINTTFSVWILPSSKSNEQELPEIGGNDPSVLYVKPGSEADLDSVIQDTIRLTASAKDTCSESCEKSTPIWQYTNGKTSFDQRWSKLLEIKDALRQHG